MMEARTTYAVNDWLSVPVFHPSRIVFWGSMMVFSSRCTPPEPVESERLHGRPIVFRDVLCPLRRR